MTINSWSDVDNAVKKIGELDIAITQIEGETTIKTNEIKEAAKVQAQPLNDERDALVKLVEAYCECNKAEFAKKRSRELVFGTVAYRLVKSVSIPRAAHKLEALIKSIKAFGFINCLRSVETVDKDAVAELADGDLVKLGIKRTVRDSFRIEPNMEKIREG
jgi:phage host-nuclease inhibitor protein Gam